MFYCSGQERVMTTDFYLIVRWPSGDTRWPSGDTRWPPGDIRWPSGDHQVTPGDHQVTPDEHQVTPGDTRCPPGDTRCPYPHTFYFKFFCFHLIRGPISTHAPFLLRHLWKHPVQRGKRLQMVEVSPVYQQHRCDWAWNRTIWSWALKEAA